MRDQVRRLLTKLQASITRGIIKLTDDTTATQTVQVELRFDEIADAVELFQPFGVSFNPTKGSEVLVFAIGSSQDNLVATSATDRSIRPVDIKEGEGGLYTPTGWKLFCHDDDRVDIGAKDLDDANLVAWAEKVEDELTKIKTAHNDHTHKHSVCSGGQSAPVKDAGTTAKTTKTYTPAGVACDKTKVT